MIRVLDLKYGRSGDQGQSFKMALDLSSQTQSVYYKSLAAGTLCDPYLTMVLVSMLVPGDTFVDIGAHIGYFPLLAIQMIGETGRVLAFEPNPAAFRGLTTNIILNRATNVHAFNCALSDRAGTATLHVHGDNEGLSTLHPVASDSGDGYRPITVMTETLDSFCELIRSLRVRMIKIDVEGHEQQVIAGGLRFIDEAKPDFIVFEVNNHINGKPNKANGEDFAIRRLLHERGYHAYLIRHWPDNDETSRAFGDQMLIEIKPEWRLKISYGNILMSRQAIG